MAEKKVIELEIKTESLGSLKSQLRQAQAEVAELSAKFGATSQEAINAAKRASELKDTIADAKALTDAFNPDAKFNALSSSIGGALNGFQAFEGALGLVGVESENLQKTLLRVQSAMALSQGLQGLLEARDSFKQLGAVAVDALKGIRTGILATGIGVLVVAVGTLVAYWDDIKEALSGVSDEQARLNSLSQTNLDIENEKTSQLDSQDNILKLQGLTEKEILQLKIKQLDANIKAYEVSIQNNEATLKAQISAEKRNKEILKGILQFILAPLDLILKTVDGIGSFLGKDWNLSDDLRDWTASLIFDPKQVEQEGIKSIKEQKKALDALKNQRAGYELEIKSIDKAASDARRQASKEANDKRLKDQKDSLEEEKRLAEERAKFLQEQIELDETRQEQAWQRKQEAAEKQAEEEKAQEDKLKADRLAAEIADEERQEAAWKREQEGIEKLQQLKYDAVLTGLNLISDITTLFAKKGEKESKRAFQIQKAASIASATIQTYQSATAAYASQFVPIPDPTSPIRGAIAAGIAVAAGLGNIAKIASQKFEGGGSIGTTSIGGSGGGSQSSGAGTSNVITPNFNVVGNAQATNPLAGLGNQPIQAYVVSGEVTTAQSLDRNRVNYATFG